jgi:hypothetical protein
MGNLVLRGTTRKPRQAGLYRVSTDLYIDTSDELRFLLIDSAY